LVTDSEGVILIRRDEPQVGAKAALIKSDAELVRRCRAGDSAAWDQVVHDYSRRVYNLAYRFTGRHESAEDLTQEVLSISVAPFGKLAHRDATAESARRRGSGPDVLRRRKSSDLSF